jgi:hypothetical protein
MRDPLTLVILFALAAAFQCAIPPRSAHGADPRPVEPDADVGITEITLERTRCYGKCPAYKVTLRADGTVTYVGEAHVERIGTHEGVVGRNTFRRLAALLEAAKYFDLKDNYETRVTDQASAITSAVRDGRRKTITNYADAGPVELWGIESAIDGVVGRTVWKKP